MARAYSDTQVQLMRGLIETVASTCSDPGARAEAARVLRQLDGADERPALTGRQREIMDAIRGHLAEHGTPPTIREVGRVVGIGSPNGVITHLKVLRKKGYLRAARGNVSRDLVPI